MRHVRPGQIWCRNDARKPVYLKVIRFTRWRKGNGPLIERAVMHRVAWADGIHRWTRVSCIDESCVEMSCLSVVTKDYSLISEVDA